MRKEVLEASHGLDDALNTLSGLLNNDVISTLNAESLIEASYRHQLVAHQFLQDKVCARAPMDTILLPYLDAREKAISPALQLQHLWLVALARRSGDYHRRTVRRFDCTPQMAWQRR